MRISDGVQTCALPISAVNADIEPGDTVAVWGCGPVGLFTIQAALLLGAGRVIAIDHFPTRLARARKYGAEVLDYTELHVREALDQMTGVLGPHARPQLEGGRVGRDMLSTW